MHQYTKYCNLQSGQDLIMFIQDWNNCDDKSRFLGTDFQSGSLLQMCPPTSSACLLLCAATSGFSENTTAKEKKETLFHCRALRGSAIQSMFEQWNLVNSAEPLEHWLNSRCLSYGLQAN